MNALPIATPPAVFNFVSQPLRVVMIDGEPWFVAADVCAAIGIKNNRDAVEKLDDDEKGVALTDTLGGQQEMLIVNESGLNAIIMRCRDAMTPGTLAHRYRKWVTSEVLPAIRKTGRYVATPAEPTGPVDREVMRLAALFVQPDGCYARGETVLDIHYSPLFYCKLHA